MIPDAKDLELYFDTVPLDSGLAEAKLKAGRLNRLILDYLKSHPNDSLSPSELHRILALPVPLTSIRRALTTLTKVKYHLELCEMTGEKRMGIYGSLENCWEIKK
jgi:Fe2+ or Zn2+ uptake regulation protein